MEKIKKTLQYSNSSMISPGGGRAPSAEEIIKFLEDFRHLHYGLKNYEKSQFIGLKITPTLLNLFRQKCQLLNVPYTTMIKKLMKEWLSQPLKKI